MTVRAAPAPDPSYLRNVAEAKRLAGLAEDWDGYGAQPIDRERLDSALRLLSKLPGSPLPNWVPVPSGTVQLEWHQKGIDLEVEVLGPARFHVHARDARTSEEFEDEIGPDLAPLSRLVAELTSRR